MAAIETYEVKELAYREGDGVEVTLLWAAATNSLMVAVNDVRSGEAFELVLDDGENPLHVFHHPFSYAAFRGVPYAEAA